MTSAAAAAWRFGCRTLERWGAVLGLLLLVLAVGDSAYSGRVDTVRASRQGCHRNSADRRDALARDRDLELLAGALDRLGRVASRARRRTGNLGTARAERGIADVARRIHLRALARSSRTARRIVPCDRAYPWPSWFSLR